jgi:hypothetical protein
MPEYMVLVLTDDVREAELPPADARTLVEGHSAYERQLRARGAYLDGARLRPSSEGRRVSVRDGAQPRVEAGPFGEASLTGYYLVQADSPDAAVELAHACPTSPGTSLDVRPVMAGHMDPEKSSQAGRVFAFAVLGSADSQAAWVDVMDRIDASTRGQFPAGRFLGGVRLHAPERGRRLAPNASRTTFDGPFLEAKEVIGGLFFLRLATLEEAVDWAGRTAYVTHGTLEIRELWRR